jgi:hypothetical protein
MDPFIQLAKQSADSRQQTADSRQQTAAQTAESRQQTGNTNPFDDSD